MYKTLMLFSFFLMMSCSGIKPIEKQGGLSMFSLDLTEYADSNFLFTPFEPIGEYLGMGEINLTVSPKIVEIDYPFYNEALSNNGGYYFDENSTMFKVSSSSYAGTMTYWGIEVLGRDIFSEATEMLYEQAIRLDADGVVNLDITARTEKNLDLSYTVYDISGFAIKRQ